MCARLFVGSFLTQEWLSRVRDARDSIRAAAPSWRDAKWTPDANLHLTLAFFGQVRDEDIPALCEELTVVASTHSRFDLTLASFRAKPTERRARMLWAGFLDPEGECAALAADLAGAGALVGCVPDERSFNAHVTLCRTRRPAPIDPSALDAALQTTVGAPPMSVASFTLVESRLLRSGAQYVSRGVWSLGE